ARAAGFFKDVRSVLHGRASYPSGQRRPSVNVSPPLRGGQAGGNRLTLGASHPPTAMSTIANQFNNVTALTKANTCFDGKVGSHALLAADGSKTTLGLSYPGSYHFGTDAPERMEIVAGNCRVT